MVIVVTDEELHGSPLSLVCFAWSTNSVIIFRKLGLLMAKINGP